jgi:hypothetical protein
VQRVVSWLSRSGFPPARWFCWWKIKQEVNAYQERLENERIGAVLSACLQTGKPCLGQEDEDGVFTVTVCDS